MPSLSEYPAVGRVLKMHDDAVIFSPVNTNYELTLLTSGRYDGIVGRRVECLVRATARKVMTVPSGGNFIAPIFGPPRIIQGRIRYLDEKLMVIQAGCPVVVELPATDGGFDLASGPLAINALANVMAMPGARFEMIGNPMEAVR